MADALASSLINALLPFELGVTREHARNRFSIDGLTGGVNADGTLEAGVAKFEATALRLASGPLVVEVGSLALRQVMAQMRIEERMPRLRWLEAAEAGLSSVKVHGPFAFSPEPLATGAAASAEWSLGQLAGVEGMIRAEIVDAHLLFDADVTVPVRDGKVDFNEVTVEHVGPDSSMGVSRLGLYVDAPNGRSYVYQFPTVPVGGVDFERRSALLGAWVADRGNLRLQAFAEGLMRQACGRAGTGFTEEARLLFDRTAVSGDVQLSDGRFAAPGLQMDFTGRAKGRNAISLRSKAVGRGIIADMPSLSVQHVVLDARGTRLKCDAITASLVLAVVREGSELRFVFDVPKLTLSGLRVHAAP